MYVQSPPKCSSLADRATAIRRYNMRQQKIRHALVSINLIFNSREAVAFVLVDLAVHGPAALLDGVDNLLRF